jgi:hypothetical protein
MEAEVFLAIKTRIEGNVPDFNFIHVWNNYAEKLKSTDENGAPVYGINHPSLFVEFQAPNDVEQLGGGVQIYDPLIVRVHILHNEIDATNGDMDQNLNVFALKQKVFQALQGFEPDGCVAFVRISEEQDYDHTNLYHFIQTYQTNFVDTSMMNPVNGQETTGTTTLNETIEIDTQI